MNFINFNFRKAIWLVLIITLPLLSINMQQKAQQEIWVARPFVALSSVVDQGVFSFTAGIKDTVRMYLDLIGIKKDNSRLKTENGELLARLQALIHMDTENARLRKLLDFKEQTQMEMKAAKVIGRDLVLDHNTITIDKGTADGVKSGQAVICIDGVVGYTFKVGPTTSHVMLITDRYSVVDGVVQRSRAHGIVEGKSINSCSLKYVEKTEDVKVGDLVVTGGLDNLFPKGYPVATVAAVEKGGFTVSQKIDLVPVVDPNKVEEVFIVSDAKNLDLSNRFLPPAPPASATGSPTSSPDLKGAEAKNESAKPEAKPSEAPAAGAPQ